MRQFLGALVFAEIRTSATSNETHMYYKYFADHAKRSCALLPTYHTESLWS